MDFLTELEKFMVQNGIFINGKVNIHSTKFQRFRGANNSTRGKDLFVKILGDCEGATFGDWHDQSTWRTWWMYDWNKLTTVEKVARQKRMDEYRTQELQERYDASQRARREWANAKSPESNHPYLLKKKINNPHALRQIEDKLVCPVYGNDGELISIQYITDTGFKYYEPGTSPRGGWMIIGNELDSNCFICEGYATGNTIYEARGQSVLVAFTAYNLLNIADRFVRKYRNTVFYICGDNDQSLKENVGFECAKETAMLTGAMLIIPKFEHLIFAGKATDFNDLLLISNMDEVKNQLYGKK